jgi:hypothetical protein
MSEDYILLKWGTLKGYRVTDNPVAQGLIRQYMELGASASAMHQRDTSQQKQIICELLRVHQGPIINDWSGDRYTVDQAIQYIQEYGKS